MFEGVHKFPTRHSSTVGASLLAIAVEHSTSLLSDLAQSRASSLPQVLSFTDESDHPRRMLPAWITEHGAMGRWLAAFGFADAVARSDFGGDQGLP